MQCMDCEYKAAIEIFYQFGEEGNTLLCPNCGSTEIENDYKRDKGIKVSCAVRVVLTGNELNCSELTISKLKDQTKEMFSDWSEVEIKEVEITLLSDH